MTPVRILTSPLILLGEFDNEFVNFCRFGAKGEKDYKTQQESQLG